MKILNEDDKGFFLATAHYTIYEASFMISQGNQHSSLSSYLTPPHAKMLRDEIDHWLESLEDTEPQVDLFKGVDLDTTYNDQLNEAIDKVYKEARDEK